MARSPIKVASENDVTQPAEETLDFDEDNLKAIAEVYKNQGNEEYRKRDFINAIHFYTEGIKVKCKDDNLKAQLYSNRAIANFKLGHYHDSLSDAETATEFQPSFLKAIVRGASACVELKRFEEAIAWCHKGLAIDENNKTLLGLKSKSVNEQKKVPENQSLKCKDGDTKDVTITVKNNAANESEDTAPVDKASDQDDDNSREKAEVYKNKGNYEYSKKNLSNAIHFYTEGIEVNCKDDELNAKLYSNRAIAHLHLGNYESSLRDARAATDLQPTFLKAIERGAIACMKLNRFEEAITWCDKGLSIDKNNKILLELRIKSVKEQNKQQTPDGEITEKNLKSHNVKGMVGDTKCPSAKGVCDVAREEGSFGVLSKAIDKCELYLKIVKEKGDKAGEGKGYDILGDAFLSLGDFRKAIDYYEMCLKISKEIGDKASEGKTYVNLGNAFKNLGDFRKAIDYCELGLKIAKEIGDKAGEGIAYGNLGNAFENLGEFRKAIDYYELDLKIAKEVGDQAREGKAYGNLGNAFMYLSEFRKAIDYYELHLKISKEVGHKSDEGHAHVNLGSAFLRLGDVRKAIYYYEFGLKIAKEVGDKVSEGKAYGNLANAFSTLGEFRKAIDYYELHLKIAKKIGDKFSEGKLYSNLGNAFRNLGDSRKAIDYYESGLKIAKEVGDKLSEGTTYGNLGIAFRNLSDFRKSIDYFELHLKIAKEVGDKAGEGKAYGNLGDAFLHLDDSKTAIDYYKLQLKIAKEVEDKAEEGNAYGNLGDVFLRLHDSKTAIDYYKLQLKIAKEVGAKAGEGTAYGKLAKAFQSLGEGRIAMEYCELYLKIAKEVGSKVIQGKAYGSLGIAFRSLGDFRKAIDYYQLSLKIAKEVGDKEGEAMASVNLGLAYESQGFLSKALEFFELSVRLLNHVRDLLQCKDEWKINFRNTVHAVYTGVFRVLLEQGKVDEALCAAERGRAQGLTDLLLSHFGIRESQFVSKDEDEQYLQLKHYISSCTVFQAFDSVKLNLWVLSIDHSDYLRQKNIDEHLSLLDNPTRFHQSLVDDTYKQIGVRSKQSEVRCENRSLETLGENRRRVDENLDKEPSQSFVPQGSVLNTLYNILIQPITDLLQGDELVIVPDGPLWLVPYAALVDTDSKYLSESFRIRTIPSLTSLKLLAEFPDEYHSRRGTLLVGDPWVQEVRNDKGEIFLDPLPFARQEVEMIGQIVNVTPLVGKKATKCEVLKELNSVALVHIAAHGRMETGEIALTPDPHRASRIPRKEDYLLTMKDVLSVKLRARLVVLSCCHSGQGEIKAEGVVGIARAFMGAGARSVLVSLWAIDDEATLEFMRSFYHHLVEGKSASESLNKAMKCLRESDKYSDVKYWAPFVLIGDDVTVDFHQKK